MLATEDNILGRLRVIMSDSLADAFFKGLILGGGINHSNRGSHRVSHYTSMRTIGKLYVWILRAWHISRGVECVTETLSDECMN